MTEGFNSGLREISGSSQRGGTTLRGPPDIYILSVSIYFKVQVVSGVASIALPLGVRISMIALRALVILFLGGLVCFALEAQALNPEEKVAQGFFDGDWSDIAWRMFPVIGIAATVACWGSKRRKKNCNNVGGGC